MTSRLWFAALAVPALAAALASSTLPLSAQTDLDAFMRQVLARRDDNWKKLQQYVLDEREVIDLQGPGRVSLWGEQREYTWYIRDGFFVRSPVKFNGVTIGEADRRQAEAEYLRRAQRRDRRGMPARPGDSPADTATGQDDPPRDLDGLIRQTRQPQFVSSAYFLRFQFESGKYALVGRETIDGRDLLKIEYYPSKLFSNDQRRRMATNHNPRDPYDLEMQRLLNKVSRVSLWIEPASHQIVKFVFDNIPEDVLPAQWLVRVTDLQAAMTMDQPFPDVWLPRDLDMHVALTLAIGDLDVRYSLQYRDYRRADVTSKVTIPDRKR